jgi:LacI family transcriptional regulator
MPVMYPCDFSVEGGSAALYSLLDEYPDTTAVIVWNDISAWGAVQAAETCGLRIPDDLSLISFNYSSISNLAPFKPTVIDIRLREMATRAAQMLITLLMGDELSESQVLLSPRLIIGDSTAARRDGARKEGLCPGKTAEALRSSVTDPHSQ